jgi:hypothetical protein
VVEGCTLADLMDGASLLAALLSDESDRKHKSLRQSSKVFVYLMESLGPAALRHRSAKRIEAPKRVVDFLVEFEKNHLASAAAAAAAAAVATTGNMKETKPIEKGQETNPEEKGKDDSLSIVMFRHDFDSHVLPEKHSEDLSLESPAAAVEDSGLLQERTSEEIAAWLSLSEAMPEERTEDTEHSEHLSLESLAAAVEDFTPRHLRTRIRQPEQPLNLYCAARLWATSGLLQERRSEEIAAWLSLSEAMAKEAEDAFTNLQGLKEPLVSGHGCKDGRWLQHVFEGMQNEAQCLGRFMFTSFLEYICERQCSMKDMSRSGIAEIEKQVKEWKPSGARGQLEQQLLLKEVRIGRRSQELPSWTGVVSAHKQDQHRPGSRPVGPVTDPLVLWEDTVTLFCLPLFSSLPHFSYLHCRYEHMSKACPNTHYLHCRYEHMSKACPNTH